MFYRQRNEQNINKRATRQHFKQAKILTDRVGLQHSLAGPWPFFGSGPCLWPGMEFMQVSSDSRYSSRAKQFSSVWFSAKVASCHDTGDKEGKVQELAILDNGEGPEPAKLAGITVFL